LAGLGARELSMSPVHAARVRYALRAVRCEDLERIANDALSVESGKQVHDLLRDCAEAV
jgi:phosphoenolpyruvate-protein kinase (PTS system EI component)